jgi:hypothetical protein
MVGIEISGGLGNQLFEYAFIYNQHRKLKTGFFLMKTGVPISLYKYFELEKNLFYYIDSLFFNYYGFKLFFSHYLRSAFYSAIVKLSVKRRVTVDNKESPTDVISRSIDNTLYNGYFQSVAYHAESQGNLQEIFQIRHKYSRAFSKQFAWLSKHKTVVAIHIRKTDYKTDLGYLNLGGDDLSLPLSYYHKLIRKIHEANNFYVILSDEIDSLESEFHYLENKHFSKENEITDFQLMLNADICVIANSTFSWWAAYLNKKENKIIYCPKHFLGFLAGIDYPAAIYPASWTQVPVI